MKAGWSHQTIGDICKLINGRAYSKPELLASGPTPVLRVGNFFTNNNWYYSDLKLDEDKYCDDGDLLYAWSASFGPRIWRGGRVIYHYHIWKIIPDERYVDQLFLYHFLDWDKDRIKAEQGAGTTMIHVTKASMEARKLALPPLPEQRRIVAILDEAFAGLEALRANAEKNLQNARELFDSYLKSVFSNDSTYESKTPATKRHSKRHAVQSLDIDDPEAATRTGGRAATTRHIAGDFSLCVGMPKEAARQGWRWHALTDLARMESGHTPSRRHPEYWGGDVPWIGIRDAKRFHGAEVNETEESTNQLGLANSSARLLPAGTVCLSRTASVGYVTIMSRPMATSQDFVNWVCGNELDPHFLSFLFLTQGEEFFKFSSGAVHQTIYFPEAKAFHVCIPSLEQQRRIAAQAEKLKRAAADLERVYMRKLAAIDELKQSILQKAFAGELTSATAVAA